MKTRLCMDMRTEEGREKAFCAFLLLCIGVGAILHVVPYFYNRALWIDEAMLASSICTRTFGTLVTSPLDFGQSAAIGWLFIEKAISNIFGNSEVALRIFQLFSSFGCMILLYGIMRGRVKRHYALLAVAFFSLTNRFIYYGNELKPYMFDNFCCLLILFLWQNFKSQKLRQLPFVAICAVMIWCSFPAVFFVASCMVFVCISEAAQFHRERKLLHLVRIALCAPVLCSFVLNYVLWLKGTSDNAGGMDYWSLLRFPIVPKSAADVITIAKMAFQFFSFYGNKIFVYVLCLLLVLWCATCIRAKNDPSDLLLPFTMSLVLLLGASHLGFYPIQDRLVQSWSIFMLVFAAFMLNAIEANFKDKTVFSGSANNVPYLLVVMVFLAYTGASGCRMLFARGVYNPTSEVKSAVRYLKENLTEEDAVYVYVHAIPIFLYEFGYKDIPIVRSHYERPENDGRIFYGNLFRKGLYQKSYSYESVVDETSLQHEVCRITQFDSVYLFASHTTHEEFSPLVNELKKYGDIELVNQFLEVRLYHFIRSHTDGGD